MRAGEEQDFDGFTRRAGPLARAAAETVLHDRTAAEQAFAEALQLARRRWRHLAADPRRDLWLLGTAVRVALAMQDAARQELATSPPSRLHHRRLPDSPIMGAFLTLPQPQREALVLRHVVGLSELEVADALDLSPGKAQHLLAKGLGSLRRRSLTGQQISA